MHRDFKTISLNRLQDSTWEFEGNKKQKNQWNHNG